MLVAKEHADYAQAFQGEDDPRLDEVSRAVKRFGYQQDALIEVLHIAQHAFGYLDEKLLTYIAQQMKLPLGWVYGVASFYNFFSFQPPAAHNCVVCTGTACYVEGAQEILQALEAEFGVKPGQTTPDGRFSVTDFRCPGSCGLAPVLVVDGELLGRETAASVIARIRALLDRKGEPTPTEEASA
ncbi:MAG: NAD(P)H-dependent oxidoreductase subunit E [Chloroflexota bacterium]